MDTALISAARTVQLICLAIMVIVGMVAFTRAVTQGGRGFGELMVTLGVMLVGLYGIVRPNDVLSKLISFAGGVQTPSAPGMILDPLGFLIGTSLSLFGMSIATLGAVLG
jgi:hypothetical protein